MSDRLFFSLTGLLTVLIVALATVWPQGQGARSPKPFGHVTTAEQARLDAAAGKGKPPASAAGAKLKPAF